MTTDHRPIQVVPSPPAELSELPVFVTADGRQRRTVRWLGRLSMLALAVWVAAALAGVTASTHVPQLSTPVPQLPTPIVMHADSGPHSAHDLALAASATPHLDASDRSR